MLPVAFAIILAGSGCVGHLDLPPAEQSEPIGLDERGPGGFTGTDVLTLIGTRAYTAEAGSASHQVGATLEGFAPFTIAPLADTATAHWVTYTSGGEVLRLHVEVSITGERGPIDVTGRAIVYAEELTDTGVLWNSAEAGGAATGELPAVLREALERERYRTNCPDEWDEGVPALALSESVGSPVLLVGLAWPDWPDACFPFSAFDEIRLAPTPP